MDNLEWSRSYPILTISRVFLRDSLGFSADQVARLTDADMAFIADAILMLYNWETFCERVRFITTTVLEEQAAGGQDETTARTA